jgi:hypothetical protein
MPTGRVLATQQAREAAKQLLALTGSVKEQVRRVLQQGGILADPTHWGGGLAGKWRNDWGPDTNQLNQVAAKLDELEHRAHQVVEDIFKADDAPPSAVALATASDPGGDHVRDVGQIPIPGPPPNPPTDPGAGKHGSDPWYTRGDDLITRGLARDAALFADAIGWTHAAHNLLHYLDNSGTDLKVSPDEMMRDATGFRADANTTTADEMRRITAEAAANGTYGKQIPFDTGWKGYYIGPEESKDWFYAMGGIRYAETGVATVYPPDHAGGEPRIEMRYQIHVFDRYNWDGGKSTHIGPFTVTDEQMSAMQRAGVAQEFNMSGSTETRQYKGIVPSPGQQPELPQPPGNRDGTRTDPER